MIARRYKVLLLAELARGVAHLPSCVEYLGDTYLILGDHFQRGSVSHPGGGDVVAQGSDVCQYVLDGVGVAGVEQILVRELTTPA